MAYRVVQWTTGNVGRQSVAAIVNHPDLELVGCYAWSPDKAGHDVGELCGIAPTGVLATNDVDALLALKADCVVYNPMWADVDEMVRILEAGSNIVSTAAFITGHSFGDGRRRIIEACERGGTSVFGSGINPGFADLIAIVSASGCDRIDKITVTETADSTGYDSPATELPVGFARPIDDPDLPAMTASGTAVFEDAVRLIGDALGVDVRRGGLRGGVRGDDRGPRPRLVAHPRRVRRRRRRQLARQGRRPHASSSCGSGGARASPSSRTGRWTPATSIEIDGRPTIRTKVEILPPPDFQATTFGEFMVLGMILTAMPAINAIPNVVAAPPGIVTYTDIPLPLPKGLVSGLPGDPASGRPCISNELEPRDVPGHPVGDGFDRPDRDPPLVDNPIFELVGTYVTSDAEHGVDAGEIAGIEHLGVACTTDKDAVLALDADCVNYAPLYFDIDDMCAILRSGKNFVTPSGFAYPPARDPAQTARLEAACREGRVVARRRYPPGLHRRRVRAHRRTADEPHRPDRGHRDLPARPTSLVRDELPGSRLRSRPGRGRRGAEPDHRDDGRDLPRIDDAAAVGLGLDVDEYTYSLDVAVADEDMTVRSGFIPKGTVAGMHHRWEAWVAGVPVLVFQSYARMGDDITPRFDHGPNRYIVDLTGDEPTRFTLEPVNADVTGDIGYTGRVWTAMSAINMIPQVVAAPPGVQTHLDLPLGAPRGLFRPATG